jgi:hypothetical protein
MTIAVISARITIRRRAVAKVVSTAGGETPLLAVLLVEPLDDLHRAEHFGHERADVRRPGPWLSRETLRSRRPNQTIGTSTAGTAISPAGRSASGRGTSR